MGSNPHGDSNPHRETNLMNNGPNYRQLPKRRSIRYEGYDYSSEGMYFVTLVTHHHEHLFGNIENGVMKLNEYGVIVKEEWFKSAKIRKEIELERDEFVIMPNHIHGIVQIIETGSIIKNLTRVDELVRAYGHTPVPINNLKSPSKTLGSLIRSFKGSVTTRINTIRNKRGQPIWLRNYYEHIIESEQEYFSIANYIHDNPMNWGYKDEYFS
jgi:putative transposase